MTKLRKPYRIQRKGTRTMMISVPQIYAQRMGLEVGSELHAYIDGRDLVFTQDDLPALETVGRRETARK